MSSAATEIKEALDGMRSDFDEFKSTINAKVEESGRRSEGPTSDTIEKLEKMERSFTKAEDQIAELKAANDATVLALEEKIDRLTNGSKSDPIDALRADHFKAFEQWVRTNDREDERAMRAAEKALGLKAKELDRKDVTIGTDAAGGHAVPENIAAMVRQRAVLMSPWREVFEWITVGSDYKELVDLTGLTSGWIGETGTRTGTATPTLQQVTPTMGELYAYPTASEWSLDDVFFDVAGWLTRSAGREFARAEGVSCVTGDGTNQMTGFLDGTPVATADHGARAFGVLQYVPSTDAALITVAGLVDLVYELDEFYEAGASMVMNKKTVGTMRQLANDGGDLLWSPGLNGSELPTFLGFEYRRAAHMPDIAANAFPVAFGDFREGYMAVDRVGLRITRDEVTAPGFVKFYMRRRQGGIIRNDEAIKVLKIAIS